VKRTDDPLPVPGSWDAALATGIQKGMDSGFDRLDAYLETL
jgi:hypothetical protein